jgi:hypothetical protein
MLPQIGTALPIPENCVILLADKIYPNYDNIM